jgi:ABC-type cobalamin/Fe3+-siderophores transport system ATPase subunit
VKPPVIRVRDLVVHRAGKEILSVERWEVGAGCLAGVLGPNGAGKSTLLKCLTGVVRSCPGSVDVLGRDIGRLGSFALTRLRRRVAYLAQLLAPGSEMPLTLREVVSIGRTGRAGLFHTLHASDWQLADQWIERLGLAAVADQPYATLSGGEQRKALLAMAMVQQPEILLLDEPTANLDVFWREQLVATLELLRETKLTIVLVCHDLEALPPSTDQLLVLQHGQPVAQGSCGDVLTPRLAEDLYGSHLTVLRRGARYMLAPQVEEVSR